MYEANMLFVALPGAVQVSLQLNAPLCDRDGKICITEPKAIITHPRVFL